MSYKVLYRKYRPKDFNEVIAQDYIVRTLKNSIINNNISHAYIFSGPRGTGKTSTAKIFAKSINCLNNSSGNPCHECDLCKNFGENPDIVEIDAASNNGVDEIRNLIENIRYTPTSGKYKIYIIDEVHMMTTSAFNALLLTLEEPPAHAVFILATTNIENVPVTILSRCQRFDFQKVKEEEMVDFLANICEKEKLEYESEALEEIAYIADGGVRDSLSLLDQLSKTTEKISLNLVENQIKTVSTNTIENLLDSIKDGNVEKFMEITTKFKELVVDYKILIKKIINVCSRRAIEIKTNGKQKDSLFSFYKDIILELTQCLNKININVNPYTIIEVVLLDYLKIQQKDELKEFENKETTNNSSLKTNNNYMDIIEIRVNNCFVNAQKQYLEQSKGMISNICSKIDTDGKIKSILMDSSIVCSSDKYIIFSCQNDHLVNQFNSELISVENLIKKHYSRDVNVIFISEKEWQNAKEDFVKKKKSGYVYELKAEKSNTSPSMEIEINDVFDIQKVEIE